MAFKSHDSLLVFVLVSILATATFDGVKGTSLGAWLPLQNPNDPHVVEIAKFAVAEHNKEAKASLVFITVVKGESQLVFGLNYQGVVLEKRWGKELLSFQEVKA
ncbi:hypothetical protein ACJIZ3_012818 [Penstemon smallii]|uniref:Cystatin domain-containing protein n=1 Tax=Penstemon smallii TaxID=265156 RepID=A0ABD3UQ82_9LAMI